MDARRIAIVSAVIGLSLAAGSSGQSKTDAKAFFESASKSVQFKDAGFLKPASGVAMRNLTSPQSVQDLREYLVKSDSLMVLKSDGDPQAKVAHLRLQRFLNDRSLQSIQLVSLDFNKVQATATTDTKMKLCDGAEPYCSTVRSRGWEKREGRPEQLLMSLGSKADDKPAGEAVFVRDGANVSGVVNVGTQIYVMRQLRDGVFAVTTSKPGEIERSKNDVLNLKRDSADKPKPAAKNSKETLSASGAKGDTCPNPSATQVVEVAVMYTARANDEALKVGYSMKQLIDTAEVIANKSFQNSKINGEIRVTHLGVTKYVESGDFEADINELLKNGGKADDVRLARRKTKADVAIMIVDDSSPTNCGIAAGISVPKDQAYAVVNWKCITDKFSFIHEIGHLAGAWHDPDSLGSGYTVDPSYAHGYVTTGNPPMATIMAYRESCPVRCGRRWYWSNPHIKSDDGQALGTPEKSFDACVWRQRLPAMASFNGG